MARKPAGLAEPLPLIGGGPMETFSSSGSGRPSPRSLRASARRSSTSSLTDEMRLGSPAASNRSSPLIRSASAMNDDVFLPVPPEDAPSEQNLATLNQLQREWQSAVRALPYVFRSASSEAQLSGLHSAEFAELLRPLAIGAAAAPAEMNGGPQPNTPWEMVEGTSFDGQHRRPPRKRAAATLPANEMWLFGQDPMTQNITLMLCPHCNHRVRAASLHKHLDVCKIGQQELKAEQQRLLQLPPGGMSFEDVKVVNKLSSSNGRPSSKQSKSATVKPPTNPNQQLCYTPLLDGSSCMNPIPCAEHQTVPVQQLATPMVMSPVRPPPEKPVLVTAKTNANGSKPPLKLKLKAKKKKVKHDESSQQSGENSTAAKRPAPAAVSEKPEGPKPKRKKTERQAIPMAICTYGAHAHGWHGHSFSRKSHLLRELCAFRFSLDHAATEAFGQSEVCSPSVLPAFAQTESGRYKPRPQMEMFPTCPAPLRKQPPAAQQQPHPHPHQQQQQPQQYQQPAVGGPGVVGTPGHAQAGVVPGYPPGHAAPGQHAAVQQQGVPAPGQGQYAGGYAPGYGYTSSAPGSATGPSVGYSHHNQAYAGAPPPQQAVAATSMATSTGAAPAAGYYQSAGGSTYYATSAPGAHPGTMTTGGAMVGSRGPAPHPQQGAYPARPAGTQVQGGPQYATAYQSSPVAHTGHPGAGSSAAYPSSAHPSGHPYAHHPQTQQPQVASAGAGAARSAAPPGQPVYAVATHATSTPMGHPGPRPAHPGYYASTPAPGPQSYHQQSAATPTAPTAATPNPGVVRNGYATHTPYPNGMVPKEEPKGSPMTPTSWHAPKGIPMANGPSPAGGAPLNGGHGQQMHATPPQQVQPYPAAAYASSGGVHPVQHSQPHPQTQPQHYRPQPTPPGHQTTQPQARPMVQPH